MSDIIIGQPNFPKELLGIIRDFFRNGTFTDLTIISQDGVHFLVHRAVVSASSAHLCAAHHMGGGTHLTDVQSAQLQALIDFMYSGDLQISGKTVYALFHGAQSLGIHSASQLCQNFIRDFPDQCSEHVPPLQLESQLLGQLFPITIKPEPVSFPETALERAVDQGSVPVKRGRGRPRKNSQPQTNPPRSRKRKHQEADLDIGTTIDFIASLSNAQVKPQRKSRKKTASMDTTSETTGKTHRKTKVSSSRNRKKGGSPMRKTKQAKHKSKAEACYPWSCEICKMTFKYHSLLQYHSRKHQFSKVLSSAVSNLFFPVGLKPSDKVDLQNNSYKCMICQRLYRNVWTAKSHVALKHSQKLQCLSCDKTFAKKNILQGHVLKSHNQLPSLVKCQICPRKVFLHKRNLIQHIREAHCRKRVAGSIYSRKSLPTKKVRQKRSYVSRAKKKVQAKKPPVVKKSLWNCVESQCAEVYNNEMELTKHVEHVHPEANHSCLICGYSNKLSANLLIHVRVKHKRKSLNIPVCEICDKTFSRKSQVIRHKFSKHSIIDPSMQLFACNFPKCKYVAVHKEGLRHHQKKHQEEKLFSCDICDKKLKTAVNVEKHKNKVHRNIRPYICDQCGQSYGEPAELRSHLARHGETKSFHCEKCLYSTHEKGNFKSHLFCRHGIKFEERMVIHQCEQCEFSTDSKTRFHDHMKCHNNIRDLPCPQCGKLFVTKKCLRGHVVKVHGSKSLACQYCGYATADKSKLNIHVKVMHTHRGFKPYKCVYCDFHCATSGNCRKHVMHKHKGMEVKYEKLLHAPSEQAVVMMEPVSAEDIAPLQPSYHNTTSVPGCLPLVIAPQGQGGLPSSAGEVPESYLVNSQPNTAPIVNIVQGQTGYEIFQTILGHNITTL